MSETTDHFDRIRQMFKDAGVDVRSQAEEESNQSLMDFIRGRHVCLLQDIEISGVAYRAGEEIPLKDFEYHFGRVLYDFRKA